MFFRWLCRLFFFCVAQKGIAQGAVRVEILSGGNLSFIFNSIGKYKNGITTPPNFTVIGITVDEVGGMPNYLRWELLAEIEDADGDGFITGTNPANQLPFSTVEISTATVMGCISCLHFYPGPPNLSLTNFGQVVADGNAMGGMDDIPPNLTYTTDKIGITYYVGTSLGNNLLGSPSDFYSDVIILTLTMYDF